MLLMSLQAVDAVKDVETTPPEPVLPEGGDLLKRMPTSCCMISTHAVPMNETSFQPLQPLLH